MFRECEKEKEIERGSEKEKRELKRVSIKIR